MLKRLLVGLLPGFVIAIVAGVIYAATQVQYLTSPIWAYAWMILVALLFLVLGAVAFAVRAYRWIIPAAVGFVVQTVGILLCYRKDMFDKPWEPLVKFTIPAVLLVLLGLLVVWGITLLRARLLERKMLDAAGASGADPNELERIRNEMKEALSRLRRAGGRGAVYELPWFLVIGEPGVGKTVAICNSGLAFPFRRDKTKGVGGTKTFNWFFTNELIFLDTPGKWSTEIMNENDREYWLELIGLLRRYRARRPLDGIVVVVPAKTLLTNDDRCIRDQAGLIREVIDLLQTELRFRFPVYLVVSKSDLIDGFGDFFYTLSPQRHEEMLGWANEDPNCGRIVRRFEYGFETVVRRLEAIRLEALAACGSVRLSRRILFFVEEFKRLQPNLAAFVGELFRRDPYHEAPVFRGFFFTSGLQGVDTPARPAMDELARYVGVRVASDAGGGEKGERSYFLLELFRRLMIDDEGLVDRSKRYRWRRRRFTLAAAIAPALVGLILLLPVPLTLLLNRHVYTTAASRVPTLVKEIESARGDASGAAIKEVLDKTDEIREFHYKMTGPKPLLMWLWMRKPGKLADRTFEAFRDQYVDHALNPTLREANDYVVGPYAAGASHPTCSERVEVLNAVTWLAGARFASDPTKLKAFRYVWRLRNDDTSDELSQLLSQFHAQYRYLKNNTPPGENFLREFSLLGAATEIERDCGKEIAMSVMNKYRRFQEECQGVRRTDRDQAIRCYSMLTDVRRSRTENQRILATNLEDLRRNLKDLSRDGRNPEAGDAYDVVKDLHSVEAKADECEDLFSGAVVPRLKEYVADDDDVIGECQSVYGGPPPQHKEGTGFLKEKAKELVKRGEAVQRAFDLFSATCGQTMKPDLDILVSTVDAYRHQRCLPRDDTRRKDPPKNIERADDEDTRKPPDDRKSGYRYVSAGYQPKPGFRRNDLVDRAAVWLDELEAYPEDRGRITSAISAYGIEMQREWKHYLSSLRIKKDPASDPASWLSALAATREIQAAINAAITNTDAEALPPEAAFLTYKQSVEVFDQLDDFVKARLGEYQDLLSKVARDLRTCNESAALCQEFQNSVTAEDDDASLVKARAWVRVNAAAVCDGSLTAFLIGPLDVARDALESPAPIAAQWSAMTADFVSTAEGRFPIDPMAKEKLTIEAAGRLFGAKSGAIPGLLASGPGRGLSDAQVEWLKRANRAAEGLCGGSDTPTPVAVELTIYQPQFTGEKFEKDYVALEVIVGGTETVRWNQGDPLETRTQSIELLGDKARDRAELGVKVAKKQSWYEDWAKKGDTKDETIVFLEEIKGETWAPLRLLLVGLKGSPPQKKNTLVYAELLPGKDGEKGGKVEVKIEAESSRLPALLELLERGLPSPPGRN